MSGESCEPGCMLVIGHFGPCIGASDLTAPAPQPPPTYVEAKRAALNAFHAQYLSELMAAVNSSVSAAAKIAGLDRSNFRRLLKRHGFLKGEPDASTTG